MFTLKNTKMNLTFFIFLVLTLAATVNASGHAAARRDHASMKRIIKKRVPFPDAASNSSSSDLGALGAIIGAGSDPSSITSSASDSASTSSSSSTSASDSASLSSSSSTSVSSSTSASSSSSSASSSSVSSTSSTTSTSSSSQTTQTSQSLDVIGVTSTPTGSIAQVTQTLTQSDNDPETTDTTSSASNSSTTSGLSTGGKTTLITFIAIGAGVAGIALAWTIFRKYKLGRSKKFDQRLQPIDWQPTHDDDDGLPSHRLASDAASFRSGVENNRSGYGATSDAGHGDIAGLPDHDFTAGPTHLAPVGGYADLARGSSPQPFMQELNRGPSMSRPNYDASVPLHHQTNYGAQDTYDYSRRY